MKRDVNSGDRKNVLLMPLRFFILLLFFAGCTTTRHIASSAHEATPRSVIPEMPPSEPIPAREYASRRAALMGQLSDGVFVAFGSEEPVPDFLPYGQDPNFRYLTGIVEPGAALVIEKSGSSIREVLFVLQRDPVREVWEGTRLGAEGAMLRTGIPSRTIDELPELVGQLLQRHATLFTLHPLPPGDTGRMVLNRDQQLIRSLLVDHPGVTVQPVVDAVRRLRIVKSPGELDLIRRAVYITNQAHVEAMLAVEPGLNEFEIQALIEGTFRRYGAERPAFSSIVGSGPNATILHYTDADRFMRAEDMVVIDIGASYHGYAADVTRTLPVDGVFSPEQRLVYGTVLEAQKAAEALVRPGASWAAMNRAADRVIAEGLTRMGLIDGPDAVYDCAIPRFADPQGVCSQIRLYYMHGLGHGIGLDVHDPDFRQYGDILEVGMAFTIEPGIYVRSDAFDHLPDTPRNREMIERLRPALLRFQNIGVRLEDDYIVTDGGADHLTRFAPREIDEVEEMMRQSSWWNERRRGDVVEWYRGLQQ
jgi:Xaa-Pro aminopeptidase